MNLMYQIAASIAAPLISVVLVTPFLLKLAHRHGWYDDIDDRKIHTKETPHIGGVGIFAAMVLGIALFYLANSLIFKVELIGFGKVLLLLTALLAIHVTGIIDDFKNLRARYKFLLQLIFAIALAVTGFLIKEVSLPWSAVIIQLGPAAYFISIFWIAGMSNAVNFLDGMDGLSGGAVAIATLTYGIVFTLLGSFTSALIAFTICGATIGFLFFNWPPAKIFMGDNGAIFLGFALGALPFLEQSGRTSFLVVSLMLSVSLFPGLDTLMAIIRRVRRGIPIIVPDKEHIHHKLLYFGLGERSILVIVYSLVTLPCGAVIAWAASGNDKVFWLVVATWLLVVVFFIVLDIRYHRVADPWLPSPAQPKPADTGK